MLGLGVCLALAGAIRSQAATWYVNDAYVPGDDIYTTAPGHDGNDGRTPGHPKRTLNSLLTNSIAPGDSILIDTGTYAPATIPATVNGVAGNRILFQGSTNLAAGGTVFSGAGVNLTVRGNYLGIMDMDFSSGTGGAELNGAAHCHFERVRGLSNSQFAFRFSGGASSNLFSRCVAFGAGYSFQVASGSEIDNIVENSVLGTSGIALSAGTRGVQINNSVIWCRQLLYASVVPSNYTHNLFWSIGMFSPQHESLHDVGETASSWRGNTVADPMFADANSFDFHLLSASGYFSNGVWVTNGSVGYSPAIDFGRLDDTAWTNEPAPNGGRVNVGLYGGTAEASKSRTDPWLFAMSFNDGGNLMQTGRLEWVSCTNFADGTVNLQYSTNRGATWSNIATEVAATNESYTWVPDFDHAGVLWRAVETNTGVASTNARPFSVRTSTNTTFAFYVNDTYSAVNDVYCSAAGNDNYLGVASNAPKRNLWAILDAYPLRGGDTVYVDTGTYLSSNVTTIGKFDSGSPGNPVRILGSPKGTTLTQTNSSLDVLALSGASHLELEHLRLTGGRYGLSSDGSVVGLRHMQFRGNGYGVNLSGSGHVFENCLAATNSARAFSGGGSGYNQWRNGVMWNSPTIIHAGSNTLSVSNSILAGTNRETTVLFGSQVIPGDHNVVWNTGVGLTYASFADFQNAGLGMGWTNSLYADPLFFNPAGNDYHVRSTAGRYNPATGLFVNDATNSPAIDFGDPLADVGEETTPNGSRVNAGMHGGTAEASRSRTNAWVQVMNYMDGGTLDTQVGGWLRWNGGNFDPGATVTLWLSRDDGLSWTQVLASGIPAADGAYFYQNTDPDDPSALYARWKVVLDGSSESSETTASFNYRNGSYDFFINDNSTNGLVYCTTVGSDTNLGVSGSSPMRTLSALLARYQPLPGDRIFIDTGNYTETNTLLFTARESGTVENPVRLIGSTNRQAGGSVFSRGSLKFDFRPGSSNIVLSDLVVASVLNGVKLNQAANIELDGVEVRNATNRAFEVTGVTNVLLQRCVANAGATGIYLASASNVVIRHSVFREQTGRGIQAGSAVGLLLENSILTSTQVGAALLQFNSMGGIVSDYNGLHAGPDTRVGWIGGAYADNLSQWQALSGACDMHSVPGNPQMADPAGYDYHLRTEQTLGRRRPDGTWTSDPLSSPLLDAGNPATDASAEPEPNGGRVNIGRWGGTEEASKAPTIPWIRLASFGDAGSVSNGTIDLIWFAGGFSNETAAVEVSVDGGVTWGTTVASGIPITNGTATWTVGGLPDTPAAAWRVVCLDDTNRVAQTTNFFAIRNNPLDIYVALETMDLREAVYVSASGAPDNWMATSNAPISSLCSVFNRFDLEPGDCIWVDTGEYAEEETIRIGMKNSGTAAHPVKITGNPEGPYTRSIVGGSRRGRDRAIELSRAGGVRLEAMAITNGWNGLAAVSNSTVELERVRIGMPRDLGLYCENSSVSLTGCLLEGSAQAGLAASTGATVTVRHSLMQNNAQNIRLAGSGASCDVRNSVLDASGFGRFVYYFESAGTLTADFNNIRARNGANVAGGANQEADRFLIDWQISNGFSRDVNSFGYEPLFADATAYDFHLKSPHGRYDPETGLHLTNDAVISRLIDLGDPSFSYSNEPMPNGGRINVGLYGNTAEASMSPPSGALVPLTMSDGGTIRGTNAMLYWSYNGVASNEWVHVQFSGNGGGTWTNIATVYADQGSVGQPWDTTLHPSTGMGVWRVCTTNGAVCGQTETLFAVKNEPLVFYVNDTDTNTLIDVYCTAPGDSGHTGLTPADPVDSAASLFARYKIEHGDTIYVDTGVYSWSLSVSVPSSGVTTNRLVIQGSTNLAAGGSVLQGLGGTLVSLSNTRNVDVNDLRLQGGAFGVRLIGATSNRFIRIRSDGALRNAIELADQSGGNEFIHCAATDFMNTGLHVEAAASFTNVWINGALVSVASAPDGTAVKTNVLIGADSGKLVVRDSVLMMNGPEDQLFKASPGVLDTDYNVYHQADLRALYATIALPVQSASMGIEILSFSHLNTWAEWNQSDSNSLAADPLFADWTAGDLHPQSPEGRYDPATGGFVTDAELSPLIDTADPARDWSLESEPNGDRVNIGVYGGTPEASRSPSAGSIVLLTLNEGGVVRGNFTLKWLARGDATNATVSLSCSTNSGVSWQTIAGSVPATQGQYVWDTTTIGSAPTARWRVQHFLPGVETAVSARDFLIHNTPLTYYVNDTDTNTVNDVYCTAPGSTNHTGLTPSSPLPALADVLTRYDLEPGDTVLMDTGEYVGSQSATLGYLDCGTAVSPVVIQGSTNHPGTVFRGGAGLKINNAAGVQIRDLQFLRPNQAALIEMSEDIQFHGVDVLWGGNGIYLDTCSNVFLKNFLIVGTVTNGVVNQFSRNTRLEQGTIWSNGIYQILIGGGTNSTLTVSNSVLGAFGLRRPVYNVGGLLSADYNNLYIGEGALAALTGGSPPREHYSVGRWSAFSGQDTHSLSHFPQFASPQEGDFRLKSSAGRFDPTVGGFVEEDPPGDTSPLIDAGDPGLACTEPSPNGGRVNIGRYGNTGEASKTPTNGVLTLISFNDGGRAIGTEVPIRWLARGAATNELVTISYSTDGGLTWMVLASGISASDGLWLWDSTLVPPSVQARLMVETADGSIAAQSEKNFSVRNAAFTFYVNDADTNLANDVYCTQPGNNANSGLTNSAPMADLNALLARYELEGGDVVYIDTGVYRGVDPWTIRQKDSAGNTVEPPVVFQGSTNAFPSRTVLDRQGSPTGITVDYGVGVQLRHLTISNTTDAAVSVNGSYAVELHHLAIGNANQAIRFSDGSQWKVANCAVYDSIRGVSIGRSYGLNPPEMEHCVLWDLQDSCIQLGNNSALVRNSILSVQSNGYVYTMGERGELVSDYNGIWLGAHGRIFKKSLDELIRPQPPVIYDTVSRWADVSGQDRHSYDGDPLMANSTNCQFYLKSRAGRYDPLIGDFVTGDEVTSPLIDAGWPDSTAWTNEPAPNGGRVNIGLFGGTPLASKSPTNSAIHLLTLNRGGAVSGQVDLNWKAMGLATGHAVRVSVSTDYGSHWSTVADSVPAALGGLTWNSMSVPSTPLALWRVESLTEPGISVTSELPFVIRNGSVLFYVNDSDTNTLHDIYCTAPGSTANTGASPLSPKSSVAEILATYPVGPGDVIYVDTGYYISAAPTVFGDLDAGDTSLETSRQVMVQGSTNLAQGGSVLVAGEPDMTVMEFRDTHGIRLRHLDVIGGGSALVLANSTHLSGEWMNIRDSGTGIAANTADNIILEHCTLTGNQEEGIRFRDGYQGVMQIRSSVLWSNQCGVDLREGYMVVSNTIVGMLSPGSLGFMLSMNGAYTEFRNNYNNLYVGHPQAAVGASVSGTRTSTYYSVSRWRSGALTDRHSLPHEPVLADPDNRDFHLKSTVGRYQPGAGWVQDVQSSPLIDAGCSNSTYWVNEPDPNGRRMNIGLYGGTPEASMTPVAGWLTMVSLNDGGAASGEDVELTWVAGGAATNHTVCIEYSPDNGVTWTNIICDWPAQLGYYIWDSVPYGRSALSRWRIQCVEDIGIYATSMAPFFLRNGGTIPYYVNDPDTNILQDVYCTAPGNDDNDGLSPATPKASLQSIFDTYELEPEDVVYVDGGTHAVDAPFVQISGADSGWSDLYVTVQGSTNPAAPTVFDGVRIALSYAENIRLRNLTIRDAGIGITLNESNGCEFERVRIEENRSGGMSLTKSSNIRLLQSVLWNNSTSTAGVGIAVASSSIGIQNSVVWGHPTAISLSSGKADLTNSVLDASGPNGRIYMFAPGGLSGYSGDFNCYSRKDGALIAEEPRLVGGSDYYNDLPAWTFATGSDQHSMLMEPMFADEASGDFHPMSTQGRYEDGVWLMDPVLSPLVDAGAPSFPMTNEPSPNGGIINIGAYGNTEQASMTQTNVPWLKTISYTSCDDVMSGDSLLYWLHGGMPSNTPVRLDYSVNGKLNWNVIASNLTAGSRQYLWNISELPLTVALYWRVVSQDNTNIWAESDCPVAVKTTNYVYYINDSNVNGLMWCSGPGLPWSSEVTRGTNPLTPLNSITALLENLPVGGGDTVYIDTGVYPVSSSNAIVLDDRNMGTLSKPLRIYGSTNRLFGGTLLLGDTTAHGIRVQNTRHIELNNIRITQARDGVSVANVDTLQLHGMELINNQDNGMSVSGGSEISLGNCVLAQNGLNGYVSAGQRGGQTIQSSTVWGNQAGAVNISEGLSIYNSIVGVTNPVYLYVEKGSGAVSGDYNLLWTLDGGMIATNAKDMVGYSTLRQWQEGGRDAHSLRADPLFVDPTNGVFQLQSRAGWWDNGTWSVSTQTSWAIDAGDPASSAYTSEPSPNGGRLNLGAYGGTPFASKSDSSAMELLPVTLNDGGVAPALQDLYWLYRGLSSTNRVRLEYSRDNGATWLLVVDNQPIGSTPYAWFSDADPTPEALWRVVLEANTNIMGTTEVPFIHRTRDLIYYVNDGDRDGDIYTDAVGAPGNKGYEPDSPLDSIQAVLDRYLLTGGDEVRVDTGIYELESPVFVTTSHRGESGNPSKIRGSTNIVHGGTRLVPATGMTGPAFQFFGTEYVDLSWIHVMGFSTAVMMQQSSGCRILDVNIQGSTGPGVAVQQGSARLNRVVVREGQTNGIDVAQSTLTLDGCVVWSNRGSAVTLGQGAESYISNSVLEASGLGRFCYHSPTTTLIRSDYNNLVVREGGQVAFFNNLEYRRLLQWTRGRAQDRYSISAEPLFHDPANGDFHPRSVAGRYQYGTGWVQDTPDPELPDYSPMIDMSAPEEPHGNEPSPNGGRRNIGLYGNTDQASKSDTNAWIQPATAQSGGITYGGFFLTWGYGGGIDSNALVQMQYSFDNGTENWIRIGEAAIGNRQYFWQSDLKQGTNDIWMTSPAARWRIYLLNNTNVMAMSDMFGLRNGPFRYYVNDDSQDGDVYTTALGDDDNLGFYPAVPKRNLQALLEIIDMEPADEVYVDTGVYLLDDPEWPIRWESVNSGGPGAPTLLRGTTNALGSWFIGSGPLAGGGLFYLNADYVDVQDVRFIDGSMEFTGVGLAARHLVVSNLNLQLNSRNSRYEDIWMDRGDLAFAGYGNRLDRLHQRWGKVVMTGTNSWFYHSAVYATNAGDVALDVDVMGSAFVSNCTIVASQGSAIRKRGEGTLRMGNNILLAGGAESSSVIDWQEGGLISDWNNLLARDSAWVGSRDGKWERLAYWKAAADTDTNSVSFDPRFHDETNGVFYLRSLTGRWDPALTNWVADGEHSPMIDLGNPATGAGSEPFPNGNRRNLGAYGGTNQASKSRTDLWLTALTMNDGGVLKGSNVVLRWASGNADGVLVTLQYSSDNGASWTNIATSLPASDGSYVWDSTEFPDSFGALWRVLAEGGSGVSDPINTAFALRNNHQNFYVNDTYAPGEDIYATADGDDGNDGLTPSTPKRTLQAILDTYDLEGGDKVYVDTGTHALASNIRIIWSRSGNEDLPVVIQGNTNGPFTLLTRSGGSSIGMDVKASDIELRHLAIQGPNRGILLETNRRAVVEGVTILEAATGIEAQGAGEIQIRNSALWKNTRGISLDNTQTSLLENLTFVLPSQAGIQLDNTVSDTIQNNIFIPASGAYAYDVGAVTSLLQNAVMDYNLYDFSTSGGSNLFSEWDWTNSLSGLRGWQLAVSNDFRSAFTNADLVSPDVPVDLHPRSEYGRYDPASGAFVLTDTTTSWAVDHGRPDQDFSQESEDNGGRLNIGMYGNTVQASKGSTNVFFETRSLSGDGQEIRVSDFQWPWPLVWSAHLVPSSEWVQVQFSADGGASYTNLATVPAYQEYYLWQVGPQHAADNGYWRVVGVNDTNLVATSQPPPFQVILADLGFLTSPRPVSGLMRFLWEGGRPGKRYEIHYSDDFGQTWHLWDEKFNGPAPINRSNFSIQSGEAQVEYTFEDRTSYLRRTRWYRLLQFDE